MRILLPLLVLIVACAFPRRSTSLSPVRDVSTLSSPTGVWKIRFDHAVVPPRQRSGLEWDEDGSPPDPFLRVYRGDTLLFESDVVRDALQPRFEGAVTENLSLPATQELRIELWDRDQVRPSPIGIWRGNGLPRSALPDADVSVNLDGGASVYFRVLRPDAHRGTGIELYEVRRGELRVVEVIEHSPAGRAGIAAGDSITAIDGETIGDLGEARAASMLSTASSRQRTLTIVHAGGATNETPLDNGYVWKAR